MTKPLIKNSFDFLNVLEKKLTQVDQITLINMRIILPSQETYQDIIKNLDSKFLSLTPEALASPQLTFERFKSKINYYLDRVDHKHHLKDPTEHVQNDVSLVISNFGCNDENGSIYNCLVICQHDRMNEIGPYNERPSEGKNLFDLLGFCWLCAIGLDKLEIAHAVDEEYNQTPLFGELICYPRVTDNHTIEYDQENAACSISKKITQEDKKWLTYLAWEYSHKNLILEEFEEEISKRFQIITPTHTCKILH